MLFTDLDMLMQTLIYRHFHGVGAKNFKARYKEDQHLHAIMFTLVKALTIIDSYEDCLDQMTVANCVVYSYLNHRQTHSFENISLYS
jgi:hypothetical protein